MREQAAGGGLAELLDAAAEALVRVRFGEFADLAEELESLDLRAGLPREVDVRRLRRTLERLAELLGHVDGVRLALRDLDPAYTAAYGGREPGAAQTAKLVLAEA